MSLRKGKTKSILESSIDSALLAVEIYNKPRTTFRVENYISLMVIAWTRLLHANFNNTIGDKYYYKKNNRFIIVDGERKAWELNECIKKYNGLTEAEEKNLRFFIALRNKIEHRHIEKDTLDTLIFGECQALLCNYENTLVRLFGEEYAINENLAFSLQFSRVVTKEQKQAQRNILSSEVQNLVEYINKYRRELSEDVFNSQEYSVKLIAIPKVASASRNDTSVEFLKWETLTPEEQEEVQKLTAIIKDKVVKVEGVNTGRHRPSIVVEKVQAKGITDFTMRKHTLLWQFFGIRPKKDAEDPFDTNPIYCYYDQAHNDYLYTDNWIKFIVKAFSEGKFKLLNFNEFKYSDLELDIKDYE
ncbi:DUF3644 domain-containing protein [Desulfosporosinus nitroreducens]|uniref:DUF3644 domain-containing protein n=1 Tax=Desulfosporosinus nitroreducens TaxID=2018668 RepID=A0ABT8QT82_9FIRM|nr:DUF3644 domain-containing protein [Desulfosporosinus nitroreducens]MDO0823096.1 DUF3644 domain-containing protein [Desulfosporosinus nitroreducens]